MKKTFIAKVAVIVLAAMMVVGIVAQAFALLLR